MFIYPLLFLLFTYTSSQSNITLDEYINGKQINSSNDFEFDDNFPNKNCDCDLTKDSCDYLCCCDKVCNSSWTEYWRNHLTCIDEKDSIGIFADRCIDKNLIWKFNNRSGLMNYTQTEDIKKQDKTLVNYCFSIDNNNKEHLKTLDDVEKDFGIKFNPTDVFEKYFEGKLLKQFFNPNSENNNAINLYNGTIFMKNGHFTIYSGIYCSLLKTVEIGKAISASCKMRNDTYIELFNEINFTDNIILKNSNYSIPCYPWKIYKVDEGFLIPKAVSYDDLDTSYRVLEVEFILQKGNGTNIQKCHYNRVVFIPENNDTINFKNSVKFIEYDLDERQKLQFRYSGNKGYLNSSPLKIFLNNGYMSNEFLLIGREKDGNCRSDSDFLRHLYNKDKPLLFGEKISYYCNYNNSDLQISQTTLFKKIKCITRLSKFPNPDGNPDGNNWVNCNNSTLENCARENKENIIIKMSITTENVAGINNEKQITGCNITCEPDKRRRNGGLLIFQTEYIAKDYEDVFKKKPQRPHFIPRLPSDLLNPLITSNVTK